MIITFALIMHTLADFYFQTDLIAKEKNRKPRALTKHLVVYSLCMVVVVVPFAFQVPGWTLFWAWILLAGSHALIDLAKKRIQGTKFFEASISGGKNGAVWLFFIDQLAHTVCILLILLLIPFQTSCLGYDSIAHVLGEVSLQDIAAVLLIVLFLCKPASIMVQKVLKCIQKQDEKEKQGVEKAGTVIGILERLIIALFSLCGQPAAIAFVIAAKSLARFKQLENQDFAERYLVGTLLSALLALGASLSVQLFLMQ
jgi:hypothetical protein